MKPLTHLTVAGAVLLGLAPAAVSAGPAAAAPPAATPAAPATPATTVTLITGDRALVRTGPDGRRSVSLEDADGRPGLASIQEHGASLYVFPQDALPLISDGTVDRRLFDVNRLIADGYDDRSTDTLPIIVTYGSAAAARSAAPAGTAKRLDLPVVGGAALDVDKSAAATAWDQLTAPTARAAHPAKLWLDARVRATATTTPATGEPTVPLTGAPEAWKRGYTGKGVKLAVLDTGYDAGHPDLAGRVTAAENFTNDKNSGDRQGHGTHTAATAAGSGAASQGRYRGEAPDADLLIGKVLGDDGYGQDSWIIAGMQWAVDQGADVVSMSLGDDSASSCQGPGVEAVRKLSERALFVIAAGNAGARNTVSTPGCAPEALTVGAIDRDGATATFSSRGPAVGEHYAKPDIAAPGVDVVAARAGGRGERAYVAMSGTSMATPHVAGAAAILAQARPGLSPAQLKTTLMSAAGRTRAPVTEQGAGPLDVARAVTQTVTGPGTTQLGDFAWPHEGQAGTTTQITLTNAGDRPATFHLDLDLRGDDGGRLPHGLAELGVRKVTVPARGTASVPVTADPDPRKTPGISAYGLLSGRITATSGRNGERLVAPVSLWLEGKTVTLTLRALDRFGTPGVSPSQVDVVSLDRDEARKYSFSGADLTFRVPAGRYALAAFVATRDTADAVGLVASVSFHARPDVTLEEDTTIVFDARRARETRVRTDRPSQVRGYTTGYTRRWGDDDTLGVSSWVNVPDFVHGLYAEESPRVRDGSFSYDTQVRAYPPRAELTMAGERTAYEPITTRAELDGEGQAALVDIGDWSNLASADLTGKLAVVSARPQVPNDYIVRDAKKAGAAGVVLGYPDHPGRWDWTVGGIGLPVVQVETADFAALRARLAAGAPATASWRGTALATSPYVYNLAQSDSGRVRARDLAVRDRDLAVSTATWYGSLDGGMRTDAVLAQVPGTAAIQTGVDKHPIAAPLTREEYFTGGEDVRWTRRGSSDQVHTEHLYDGPVTYRPGDRSATTWYRGVLRPVAPRPGSGLEHVVVRDGDTVRFAIPTWGDAAGHDGSSGSRDAKSALLTVDGTPVSRVAGAYDVPAQEATLAYTQEVTRHLRYYPGWTGPSATRTAWTFRSSSAAQGPQPLLFPGYAADLDPRNTAPADPAFRVTVAADRGGAAASLADVRIEYAVGRQETVSQVTTWTEAEVTRDGDGWTGTLDQSAASGAYVSLRVTATGQDGDSVTQTVIRAYPVS